MGKKPGMLRIRNYIIKSHDLIAVLEGRCKFEGFPKDAKVIHFNTPYEYAGISVTIESEEFDEINDSAIIPVFLSEYQICDKAGFRTLSDWNQH